MIDFSELPQPEGAPEPGTCVRVERPEPNLVLLVIDPPHRKLAVLDPPLLRDLDAALRQLEGDSWLEGLVITGREPLSFLAGADIDMLAEAEDPVLVERVIRGGQEIFARLEGLRRREVRTVAAVGGPVPGGAYELALACGCIVLADDPKSRVGLPETQLGILPAWGGSTRLPRRIGVSAALDSILKGRLLPAKPAYRKGLVDRLTPPEYLVATACDLAMGRKSCKRRSRGVAGWLVDRNPLAVWTIERLVRKQVLAQTKGRYPAALEVLPIVARSPLRSMAKSMTAEQQAGAKLAVGPVCKNLIGIFRLMEAAKKLGRDAEGRPAEPFGHGAVLGAGVMGGAIASLMAERGISTRLFDIAPEGLDAALIEHQRELAKKLKRRRIQPHERDAAIDRLDPASELSGFARSDVAIEAVAERLEIKREVFGRLAQEVSPECVLCTNTSSLSVDAIAEGLPHPERVVGLHFFNPVRRMPLVEVVRGARTSEGVVTRAAALALFLGKTPVVVKDVAGFLVNRLLGPYLDEALALVANGAAPARVDAVAEAFGMPMGPLRLLDEVGLDVASHAAASLHAAYGDRMTPSADLSAAIEAGRLGKKAGKGFYVHPGSKKKGAKAKKPVLAADVGSLVPARSQVDASLSDEALTDRLMFAMLAEAVRALDEQVVATADELDLATVFGMGFPPFRGGLLRWADGMGAGEVERRLQEIADSPGVADRPGGAARFALPAGVAARARAGRRFRG